MLLLFENDDAGYQSWLEENPNGYILDTYRSPDDPDRFILADAKCPMITSFHIEIPKEEIEPGQTIKVCADNVRELSQWVNDCALPNPNFPQRCRKCLRIE